MAHPVTWFEIDVVDAPKAVAFYRAMFEWEIATDGDYSHVRPVEGGIGGGIYQLQPGQHPMTSFYVAVENLQAALDKAVSLGGKVAMPPKSIGENGSIAFIHDPEGNWIGLTSDEQM